MAPRHLQHRLQLRVLGRPQAEVLAEASQIGFEQRPQAAEFAQQIARQIHRTLAGHPGAQKDRQQFGIGQCRRALLQ